MDERGCCGKAALRSMEMTFLACSPRSRRTGTHSIDRAFGNAPAAMLAKHAEVEQHVALELVADEEAEAARRVEPFHAAGDRRHLGRRKGFVRVHFGLGLPRGSSHTQRVPRDPH